MCVLRFGIWERRRTNELLIIYWMVDVRVWDVQSAGHDKINILCNKCTQCVGVCFGYVCYDDILYFVF